MTPIERRLLARVREKGPIGFDEFMEAALYDDEGGFYAKSSRGPGPDFVTSPFVSSLFGATLSLAVDACHRAMGEPSAFTLCEIGAARGTMMADLLGAAADRGAAWVAGVDLVLVERGTGPRSLNSFARSRRSGAPPKPEIIH